MSKCSTYKVAHAQKTLNMLRYLAITKTSLDGGKQDAEMAPKKEATLNGAGTQGEVVDPQADAEQADTDQQGCHQRFWIYPIYPKCIFTPFLGTKMQFYPMFWHFFPLKKA